MEIRQALRTTCAIQMRRPSVSIFALHASSCGTNIPPCKQQHAAALQRLTSPVTSALRKTKFSTSSRRSGLSEEAAEPPPQESFTVHEDQATPASPRRPASAAPKPLRNRRIAFPGEAPAPRKPALPNRWAEKLTQSLAKIARPGMAPPIQPAVPSLNYDFASIMRDDTNGFLADSLGGRTMTEKLMLNRTTGRTIRIKEGMTLPRALDLLQMQMRINRVQSEVRIQRFHERGGLKRKRLRSERWRKKFRAGFSAAAQRALELNRQGW
jgi:small subunit ribosomal protein MRP21